MKKLLLLIIPAVFLTASCDNKKADEHSEAVIVDTTVVETVPAAPVAENKDNGAGMVPAQVWEELKGPVSGANVTAVLNGKTIETATTDEKGMYTCKNLTKGTQYTFKITKGKQTAEAQTVTYDGTDNSLPNFQLK